MSPTPRRTKKDEAAEKQAAEATEAKADAKDEAAEAAEETADEPAEKKPRRRRASAEAAPKPAPKRKKAENVDPNLEVRAQARYVRNAPRKARLVVDHIRGKSVPEARALLAHTPRAAAEDVLGLLNSAAANAENNHELDPDDMFVKRVFVDEGPTLKRYQPRAQGRAFRIRKRTSHMTIVLAHKKEG
jgi:ribosomal protein L22